MSEVYTKGKLAKEASYILGGKRTNEKDKALELIAEQILTDEQMILKANKHHLADGKASGLSGAILGRIMLDEDRIRGIVEGVNSLIKLVDSVGEVFETVEKENGLLIEKTRVPIGVIGMIYEARPNVTIDAATLALKAGNEVILRGSSSAMH